MLDRLHKRKSLQLVLGLAMGIVFGFLLQRGGVTHYEVIMGQLLLRDFTVLKVMLSAVLVGMIGIYALRAVNLAELHRKSGSMGSTALGGLIFGVGFAVLGYCPGTMAAAVGQGSLDALLGGIPGMLFGAWVFSLLYPRLRGRVLELGEIGQKTWPELLGWGTWTTVAVFAAAILSFLLFLEAIGL